MAAAEQLLTDAQFAALLGALATFLGSLVATAKWAVGRVVKAIDDATAQRDRDTQTVADLRVSISKLSQIVQEARTDIDEVRDHLEHPDPPPRASRQRRTNPAVGAPRPREPDEPT